MATDERGGDAILDCHCHAWARWPYLPAVPDEDTRGSVELLAFEMERHGVQRAVVVCAAMKDGCWSMARSRPRLVVRPSATVSSSAAISRRLASSRSAPWAITFASKGS